MRLARHEKRPVRPAARRGAAAALGAVAVLGAAVPAAAAGHDGSAGSPQLVYVRSGPGVSWTADTLGLHPGDQVDRYLDVVSAHSAPLVQSLRLWGTGRLTDGGGLVAGVRECSVAWSNGKCGGREVQLSSPGTSLAKPTGLGGARTAPARDTRHLKLTLAVPADLPPALAGATARVTLQATGTAQGDESGTGSATGADATTGSGGGTDSTGGSSLGGALAHTGAGGLWGLLLLGVGALCAGTAILVNRRRTTPEGTDAAPAASAES